MAAMCTITVRFDGAAAGEQRFQLIVESSNNDQLVPLPALPCSAVAVRDYIRSCPAPTQVVCMAPVLHAYTQALSS